MLAVLVKRSMSWFEEEGFFVWFWVCWEWIMLVLGMCCSEQLEALLGLAGY